MSDDEKCVQVGERVWKWHESVGWYDAMDDDPAWDTEIELLNEIERLRELCYEAQAFIDHDKNCAVVMGRMNNCDCGYDEMWRKLSV